MIYHDYHSVILRLWSSRDLSKKGHREIGFGLEIPDQISPLTVRIKSLKGSLKVSKFQSLLEKRAQNFISFPTHFICNVDTVKCRENSIYHRT